MLLCYPKRKKEITNLYGWPVGPLRKVCTRAQVPGHGAAHG
jgi:hypothetical protein